METEFIVMDAGTPMPSSCWGKYRRVAVVEVLKGVKPKMISTRSRGILRIVRTWEKLFSGKTFNCAFGRAYDEAQDLAYSLNKTKGVSNGS